MKTHLIDNMAKRCLKVAAVMLAVGAFTACDDDDIDNTYSRNLSVIRLETSSEYVVLDESNPDAVALTLEWNAAHDYGYDFITTYQYELGVDGSTATVKEYEDDGIFRRQYTNRELQELLTGRFGQLTSTLCTLNLSVTASFEGPRMVVPDIATAKVLVKTYGPKQYLADHLYIGGSAVGDEPIELASSAANPLVYTWNGKLSAGSVNFPVSYADESNALSPLRADCPIEADEMEAVMVDASEAHSWIITEEENYRVTVNLINHTVKIVPAGSVIELDRLLMAGSATGGADIEVARTLENDQLYAWRGQLQAGKLYLPIEFNDATAISIVPKEAGDHDIHDGQAHDFTQTATESGVGASYWEIPAAGIYRVVVDLENRTVTIYSPDTDLKNKVVSYNNTVDGINPYYQEVTELWMWGGFNDAAHDAGLKAGFQEKYKLQQSLANPNVFVYHGSAIPRGTSTDNWSKVTATGALNFLVSSIENNVYTFGSTADAKRNSRRGYLSVNNGETQTLVAGQSDNRYAYFCVPENCNYVCVDIEKLTVIFDYK